MLFVAAAAGATASKHEIASRCIVKWRAEFAKRKWVAAIYWRAIL